MSILRKNTGKQLAIMDTLFLHNFSFLELMDSLRSGAETALRENTEGLDNIVFEPESHDFIEKQDTIGVLVTTKVEIDVENLPFSFAEISCYIVFNNIVWDGEIPLSERPKYDFLLEKTYCWEAIRFSGSLDDDAYYNSDFWGESGFLSPKDAQSISLDCLENALNELQIINKRTVFICKAWDSVVNYASPSLEVPV